MVLPRRAPPRGESFHSHWSLLLDSKELQGLYHVFLTMCPGATSSIGRVGGRLAKEDMPAKAIPLIKYAFSFCTLSIVTPVLLGGLGETWRHMQQSGYYMLG